MSDLDYEDFEYGGMHIIPRTRLMPYSMYKRTPEFRQKQMWKPQYPSRNPQLRELRYWETKNGHVHEVAGKRHYRGECVICGDVVLKVTDVSGPECRGKGNSCMRGKYPEYCETHREQRRQERVKQSSDGMKHLRDGHRKREYVARKADDELRSPRR